MAVEEENNVEDAQPAKKSPRMVVIIVGGAILVVIVFLIVSQFTGGLRMKSADKKTAPAASRASEPFKAHLFSFDQALVVNLAETNGQRYLKVNLQLEMNSAKLSNELSARSPQLLDLIITILSSKTIEEASTTIGRNRLKREIVDRINAELVTGKVINIYFTEFVIQ